MPLQLGAFEVGEPLGRGGMAAVWSARHVGTGHPAAVKVMTAERARDREQVEGFEWEVRAVAGLSHPGVVRVLDHGVVPEAWPGSELVAGSPYLVMERAESTVAGVGPRFAHWGNLRTLLVSVLDALSHAHARGVIHRDLKPGNVLVVREGSERLYRLADFGLAWSGREGAPQWLLSGSPVYMAPEQLRGDWRDFGPWTDLYALGCTAWRLLMGSHAFGKGSLPFTLHRKVAGARERYQPRYAVPEGLEGWLGVLLEPEARGRFACAAEAALALDALGEPVERSCPAPLPASVMDLPTRTAVVTLMWQANVEHEAGPASAPEVRDVPEVPARWQSQAVHTDWIPGVGLGLYGLRRTPLVGRRAEQGADSAARRDPGVIRRSRGRRSDVMQIGNA